MSFGWDPLARDLRDHRDGGSSRSSSAASLAGYTSSEFFSLDEATANALIEGYSSGAVSGSFSAFEGDEQDVQHDATSFGNNRQKSRSAEFEVVQWNERFQTLLQQLYAQGEKPDPLVDFQRTGELQQLCEEFAREATRIGVVIIKEMFLPLAEKTIQPVTYAVGGVAGGEKYIYRGIFFKFAVDFMNLYGGHEFALKTAEHELKSIMAILDCRVSKLHTPLMALITYRGFSLVAQSVLPIDKSTLLYGSDDSGKTVQANSKELVAKLEVLGAMLNLKGHYVWDRDHRSRVLLTTPADLEGHLGKDNRYYVLDCSRLFPPVAPPKGNRTSYLYQLMRPEFVKRNPTPLSSDAFSRFGKDYFASEHDKEVVDATKRLLDVVIPEFARELGRRVSIHITADNDVFLEELSQLVTDLHLAGINVRYLMILFENATDRPHQELIVTEMVSRTLKNSLRDKWRQLKTKEDQPYFDVVASYFNTVFGQSEDSQRFWQDELPEQLFSRFLNATRQQHTPRFELRPFVKLRALFFRLQQVLGVSLVLSSESLDLLFSSPSPFKSSMIERIEPRIKHIHTISFQQGTALSRMAMITSDVEQALSLLQQATIKYQQTLAIKPNCQRSLYNWGLTILEQARLIAQHKTDRSSLPLLFQQACQKFERCLRVNPKDGRALSCWGIALLEQSRLSQCTPAQMQQSLRQACERLSEGVRLQPTNFEAVYNYGNAMLHLANLLVREIPEKESSGSGDPPDRFHTGRVTAEADKWLKMACDQFELASGLSPSSVDSLRNHAVSLAKRARLASQANKDDLFQKSFEKYRQASSLRPRDAELLFDWGNALYRYAMTKKELLSALNGEGMEKHHLLRDYADFLLRAADKYQESLLAPVKLNEAAKNLAVVLKSLVSVFSRFTELRTRISEVATFYARLFDQELSLGRSDVRVHLQTLSGLARVLPDGAFSQLERSIQRLSRQMTDSNRTPHGVAQQEITLAKRKSSRKKTSSSPLQLDWSKPVLFSKRNEPVSLETFECLGKLNCQRTVHQLYLVQQKGSGRRLVLKAIAKEHFVEEKGVTRCGKHPFIAKLFQAVQTSTHLILTYEPMEAQLLHLARARKLTEEEARFYLGELLLALEYLQNHQLPYRKLKPESLLVHRNGHLALVPDLGLEKSQKRKDEESTYALTNASLIYFAPELLQGDNGSKALWWAVGAVAFELLTNKPLFAEEQPHQLYKNVFDQQQIIAFPESLSAAARSLLTGLLNRDPKERFGLETKRHPFFTGLDWDALQARQIRPPMVPKPLLSMREIASPGRVPGSLSTSSASLVAPSTDTIDSFGLSVTLFPQAAAETFIAPDAAKRDWRGFTMLIPSSVPQANSI